MSQETPREIFKDTIHFQIREIIPNTGDKMPKCVYCGKNYEFPNGVTIVTNKGNINYLCSSKCRKNMQMHRRKVRWITKREKEIAPINSK